MKIFKKLLSYISYGIQYLKTFGFRKKSRFVSRGERLIYHYLKDCGDNIKFKPQYKIPIPEGINKTNRAYIDFTFYSIKCSFDVIAVGHAWVVSPVIKPPSRSGIRQTTSTRLKFPIIKHAIRLFHV